MTDELNTVYKEGHLMCSATFLKILWEIKLKHRYKVLKFCFILKVVLKDTSQLQIEGISRTNNSPGLIKFDYN